MRSSTQSLLFILVSFVYAAPVFAATGDPVLTQSQGDVQLFAQPSETSHAVVPAGFVRSKFEGKHYLTKKVSLGDELPVEAWLRVFPGGRARLVYPNGDQINVGPGSFFKLEDGGKTKGMKMEYGMIRAIISKQGPRSNFKVRTPSATMGVRGTDFVVEIAGAKTQTALTLIRGSVSLRPEGVATEKEIQTGQTAVAEVKKAAETFETSKVELKRALVLTERATAVGPKDATAEPVSEAVKKLEVQAKQTAVKDVMDYARTPEEKARFLKLAERSADAQAFNQAVVQIQVAQAPVESPRSKQILREIKQRTKRTDVELRDLEKDPYQQYFDSTQSE
jgi:hypothetical protein